MIPQGRWDAFVLLTMTASCSSGSSGPSTPVNPLDISDVIYVGGATDEALLHLLDTKTKDDARDYVLLDSPSADSPASMDSPATLAFHRASEAERSPTLRLAPPAWRRSCRELLQLLGPPRVAHAHGTPYNGVAYYIVVTDAESNRKARVFTAQTSYTFDAESWQSLVRASQPITVQITSAVFETNEIPDDGGPFIGGTFKFRIQ